MGLVSSGESGDEASNWRAARASESRLGLLGTLEQSTWAEFWVRRAGTLGVTQPNTPLLIKGSLSASSIYQGRDLDSLQGFPPPRIACKD